MPLSRTRIFTSWQRFARRHLKTPSLLLALGDRIKSVVAKVETDPSDVLRDKIDLGVCAGIIALQRDVEPLIPGVPAVIGEI